MSFVAVDEGVRDWLRSVWKDAANAAKRAHELAVRPVPKWLHWQPWQWCYEATPLAVGRTPVLALVEGFPVGFLTLWPPTDNSGAVYLEHIGAFPGDINTPLWNKRYDKVGWSLFAYALHTSVTNGFCGRVGLHVADAETREKVYRKYEASCSGLFLPERTGIAGPTPYGAQKNLALTYLETTEAGAGKFLEAFRHA